MEAAAPRRSRALSQGEPTPGTQQHDGRGDAAQTRRATHVHDPADHDCHRNRGRVGREIAAAERCADEAAHAPDHRADELIARELAPVDITMLADRDCRNRSPEGLLGMQPPADRESKAGAGHRLRGHHAAFDQPVAQRQRLEKREQ